MSKRPKVILPNYRQVFEHYDRDDISSDRIVKCGHRVAALLFRPRVTYDDGAEQEILQAFEDGKQFMLLLNHVNKADVMLPASLVQREKILNRMVGNTKIVAKSILFRGLKRVLFDKLGAIPAIRQKDSIKMGTPEEMIDEMQPEANQALFSVVGRKFDKGHDIAMFPEGKRVEASDSSDEELKLKDGFVKMINSAESPENILVLAAGVHYSDRGLMRKFMPNIHISTPLSYGPNLFKEAQTSLTAAVSQAAIAA